MRLPDSLLPMVRNILMRPWEASNARPSGKNADMQMSATTWGFSITANHRHFSQMSTHWLHGTFSSNVV